MLSDFSPILDHCSGRPERFSNPNGKTTHFRAECSEIAKQELIAQ